MNQTYGEWRKACDEKTRRELEGVTDIYERRAIILLNRLSGPFMPVGTAQLDLDILRMEMGL